MTKSTKQPEKLEPMLKRTDHELQRTANKLKKMLKQVDYISLQDNIEMQVDLGAKIPILFKVNLFKKK
jgi:hypothetical protein